MPYLTTVYDSPQIIGPVPSVSQVYSVETFVTMKLFIPLFCLLLGTYANSQEGVNATHVSPPCQRIQHVVQHVTL